MLIMVCYLRKYVELTRPKIESRDPIFFIGTRARSRVSGNDRLFPRGSEFGPNLEIPASPVIQLRPRPDIPEYRPCSGLFAIVYPHYPGVRPRSGLLIVVYPGVWPCCGLFTIVYPGVRPRSGLLDILRTRVSSHAVACWTLCSWASGHGHAVACWPLRTRAPGPVHSLSQQRCCEINQF